MARTEVRRCRRVVAGLPLLMAVACVRHIPVTTEAMPGNDVRIVAPGGMTVLRALSLRDGLDVGCRVIAFEGRVERLAGDSAFVRPVRRWRPDDGRRQACDGVGDAAILLLPDRASLDVQAIRADEQRTGWLVRGIVGAFLVTVSALAVLVVVALARYD